MKNFKALLWIVVFSMISSGIIAMEFKPKVYIKNKNTYSRNRSAGVLCLINEGTARENKIFVKEGQAQTLIGIWGKNYHANEIQTLTLRPSSTGTGGVGWVFSPETFSLTDKINAELGSHPGQDIVIVVDNNASRLGAWTITYEFVKPSNSESVPIGQVGGNPVVEKLKRAYDEWRKTHGSDSSSSEEESW